MVLMLTGAGVRDQEPAAAQDPGTRVTEAKLAAEPTITTAPVPSTADTKFAEPHLNDVACTQTGTCFAVGSFYRPSLNRRPLVETLQDGRWTAAELRLPRDTEKSPSAELTAVSCAGTSLCVAVGEYEAKGRGIQPLVATWNGSRWSARSPRLPADRAAKNFAPLVAVSCGGPRACVAVGSYATRGDTVRPLMVTLRQGRWSSSAGRLTRRAHSGVLDAVDCPAPRACVAVGATSRPVGGSAVERHPHAQLLSRKGWRPAAPPVPQRGRGSVVLADLTAISCPGKRRCTAVGYQFGPFRDGDPNRVLVGTLGPNGWKAGYMEPPSGTRRYPTSLAALSCADPRSCVGVGKRISRAGSVPVVGRIRGRDGSGVVVPPPTEGSTPVGDLYDVTCAPSACLGVGSIEAQDGTAQPLLVRVSGGAVEPALVSLPPDAGPALLKAVALQSPTTAVAVGSVIGKGLLVTGIDAG